MSYVRAATPSSSRFYQHPQDQNRTSANTSSHSDNTMSYHRSTSSHSQHQWSLTPSNPVASPSSASPFSPSYHNRPARNVTEIIPRLYISDLAFVENPALLSSYRITHILSALTDTVFRPPPPLLPVQPVRLQVRVEDLPFAELAAHLPSTTAFIHNALSSNPEARIVVHCAEGISRSVSVVAAYLMAQYGWAPLEAVHYIKSKRRVANPNFGFVQQLHEYARDSLGRTVVMPPYSGSS